MCSINKGLSLEDLEDKEKIFGATEVADSNIEGLELRYEVEHGQEGEHCYLRQRVFRDKDGNYFMAVKGGLDIAFGIGPRYPLRGREVLISIRPEALAIWAEHNLCGDKYKRAIEEFTSGLSL